jgi:heme O synthase-like polyprenyltransferase
MLPNTNTIMGNSADIKWRGTNSLFPVLTEVKTIIFSLLALIAVAVFIYLWFKLVSAQWKPDEFKKAMMGFVYAVIWLAIIPLAWALVKLISSLQF